MYPSYECPCCYQAPVVSLREQVWPRNRVYPDYNPYYVNRGGNRRIIYRYASINNQAVQVGEPIVVQD